MAVQPDSVYDDTPGPGPGPSPGDPGPAGLPGVTSAILDVAFSDASGREWTGPAHVVDFGGPGGPSDLSGRDKPASEWERKSDVPVLLAIHGLGGSHVNWLALAPLVTDRVRLIAVDLVGHGLSARNGRPADLEAHRDLVAAVVRKLDLGPVTLVGNSMGGMVSVMVAAGHPEMVDGLVLVDPALPFDRFGLVHPRILANFLLCAVPFVGETFLTQRRRWLTPEQTVRRVLTTCCVDMGRVPSDVVAAHVALTARIDRAEGDDAYLRSARSLSLNLALPAGSQAALDRLGGKGVAGDPPGVPVLLLQGDSDLLVPLAATAKVAEDHPAWTFAVAEDVGHVPMLEVPEWTAAQILSWLDTNEENLSAALRPTSSPEG